MRKYIINQCLHRRSMKNGTEKLVQIFDHLVTLGFLIVRNFVIKI